MTRRLVVLLLALALSSPLVACGGAKKKFVTRQDFEAVTEYVDKNMRTPATSVEDRKKYAVSQLGPPHHADGDTQYWYSTAADCYYMQSGPEGWTSFGIGALADCKKWGVTP